MGTINRNFGNGNKGKKSKAVLVEDVLPDNYLDMIEEGSSQPMGINGDNFPDCSPTYKPIKRAKVIQKYDSYITLGGDAPRGPGSGYSAFGARCSSIDLVTGRLSSAVEASTNPNLYALDNFNLDAARVYICQRTDIDYNFGISKGSVGDSIGRSAVAAKADAIRLYGREGIKLVTGEYGEYNSQGGKISTRTGIDLMAGNNDADLQPIPKGDNLVMFLEDVLSHIGNIYEIIFAISKANVEFSSALAGHVHAGPTGPVMPSVELVPAAMKVSKASVDNGLLNSLQESLKANLAELDYLFSLGSSYINSDLNRTN
jgi:hypothetical protein